MMATRKFIGLLLVATLALMLPGGAWAIGTCTDSPTFCLNQWNVQLFEDNNDVVSVFVTGTTVEFIFHQGITPPTATDFQDLYFRSTAFDSVIASFTTTDGGGTAAYILQTGGGAPGNADGFGASFWDIRHNGPGAVNDLDVTFTFSSVPGGLTAADFVTHVQFGTNCSGFAGSTNIATTAAEAGCGAAVPEPGTLLLVGSGLVGLGAVGRRKWMSRRALA